MARSKAGRQYESGVVKNDTSSMEAHACGSCPQEVGAGESDVQVIFGIANSKPTWAT